MTTKKTTTQKTTPERKPDRRAIGILVPERTPASERFLLLAALALLPLVFVAASPNVAAASPQPAPAPQTERKPNDPPPPAPPEADDDEDDAWEDEADYVEPPLPDEIDPRPEPPRDDADGDDDTVPTYYSAPSSRQAQFVLAAAEKAVREGLLGDAGAQYQRVIDEYTNKVLTSPDRTYVGVRERAIEGLLRLPEAGKKAYLDKFEPKARAMLEAALATREKKLLLDVVRRYPLTVAARDALVALGNVHLERGEAAEARHYFETVIAHPASDESTRVRARASLVLVASALQDRGALEAASGDALAASARLPVRGAERSVADLAADALKSLPARPPEETIETKAEWPSVGGDPAMNAPMAPAGDRRTRQWWQAIDFPVNSEGRFGNADFAGSDGEEATAFPPYHPVIGNGLVYVLSGLEVEAYQLYNGKLRWRGPAPQPRTYSTAGYRDRRLVFAPALDGKKLFGAIEVPPSKQPLSWSFHRIVVPLPERRLFAFDADTGKVIWSHFMPEAYAPDAMPLDDDTLDFVRRASVVSPPTVVGDTLYVVASYFEGKILSSLCAFDKATGRLRWRTLLCTGQQELNMFGQPWREYVASPIAEKDGVLYVSTNLGLVAAVDRRLGSVLWLAPYPQIPIQATMNYQPVSRRLSWYSNPPIVEGGRLYVTPLDSDTMTAFDAATGKRVFEVKRNLGLSEVEGRRELDRPDYRYLIGVRKGLVLLAGAKVAAHDAETGRKKWEFRFPDPKETATGRGGASADHVFFGSSRALYTLDVATGKLVRDRAPWPDDDGEPGNLLSAGLFFAVTSERRCQVFYQWDRVFEELSRRIAASPDDPSLLLEVGNVYKQGRDYAKAGESFARALEIASAAGAAPASDAVMGARRGLHDVHMTLGEAYWKRGEYDSAEQEFRLASENAFDDASRVRSLLAFARCYELKGDTKGLIGVYRTMAREVPNAPLSGTGSGGDVPAKYHGIKAGLYALLLSAEKQVALGDREAAVAVYQEMISAYPNEVVGGDALARDFAIAGIAALVREGGPQVYAPFEEKARALYARAMESKDEPLFREVLAAYPNSSVLERCLLDLGNLLIEKASFGKAASVLREFLLRFPGSSLERDVLTSLASCYERTGFHSAARAAIERTPPGTPGRERLANDPLLAPVREEKPALALPLGEKWRRTFNTTGGIALLELRGAPPEIARTRLFFHANRTLTCVDLGSGEVVWTRPNVDDIPSPNEAEIHWVDGTLVLATQRAVSSLDPASGEVRWQVDFEPGQPFRGACVVPGSVIAVLENADEAGAFVLRAHDAMTGDKVWEDFVRGKYYGDIVTTERFVVLHTQNPMRILAYDSFTGKRHMEIPVGSTYSIPSALAGDRLFLFRNGEFQAIDLATKAEVWKRPVGEYRVRNVMSLGDEVAVLVSRLNPEPLQASDEVHLLSGSDGRTRWTAPIAEGGYVYPAARERNGGGDTIYLNRRDRDSTFYLMAFSRTDGSLRWQAQPLSGGSPPKTVLEAGPVVVLELAFYSTLAAEPKLYVVLVDRATGKTIEKTEHPGNVSSQVQAVGDKLCVAIGKQIVVYGK